MTNELCLDGQWKLVYFPQGEWQVHHPDELSSLDLPTINASVPGNVELDLVSSGLLPEPFLGTNITELRPYELYEWWYSLEFSAPASMQGKRTELVFHGVDCCATYWLNGEELGSSDNMFIEVRLETTKSLLCDGVNKLFVRLRSPIIEAGQRSTDAISYGPITNGEQLFVRKAAHSFGWDIMPRAVSAGIWRSVSLVACEDHALTDLYFYTLSVEKNFSAAQLGLFYRVATDPAYFYHGLEIRVTGKSGASEFQMSRPVLFNTGSLTISLNNPQLWWPNGYGDAPLYEVTIELIHQGRVLASRTERIGVRLVEFIRTEITTVEAGGEFLFKVNHTPIMCKGSNWVPMDAFHSRDAGRYEAALQLFTETGCNIVRCWGGNVYEDHAFFDFCDSHGLMVWQDFAMACAVYPQTPEFSESMRLEARSVVRKLRNHASLVLWCGDNECDEAYGWNGLPDPGVNLITRNLLPQVIQQYDPHRAYLPSSPYLSPEVIRSGNMNLAPERHLWGPRDYYKSSFYKTSTDHFISEIGYHGCPNIASIQKFIEPDHLWPFDNKNEQWIAHATEVRGSQGHNATRIQLMANQIKELFGAIPESIEDFILASQISQAEAKKFFIETARLKKWRKTGIMWWNMIDGWPQFSDSVVDYYYGKKLAFHYIQRSQIPVCIMIDEPENWHVRVAAGNDSRESAAGSYRIWDADSKETLMEGSFEVEDNGTSELGKISISHAKQQLLLIEWNIQGRTYGNHYLHGFPAFSLETYKSWLPQIAAISNDFRADEIGRQGDFTMEKMVMDNHMQQLVLRNPDLEACTCDIIAAFQVCADAFHLSRKMLLCGNGGSASDCDHIVGELMKGFLSRRPVPLSFRDSLVKEWDEQEGDFLADRLQQALPAISLINHYALVTAFVNDVEPEMIFAQQVYGYGQKGDILMALSTSGNSANVLRAVQTARAIGMRTIGLTGKHGGRLKELCDVTITVPWERTPDIQERHLPIYHVLCTLLEEEFFG